MRKILMALIVLAILLASSCTSTGTFSMESVESSDISFSTDRGKTIQSAETDNVLVMVSSSSSYDCTEILFTVGIHNKTDEVYFFDDSQVEIFVGNRDSDKWRSLGQWNSLSYYNNAVKEAKNEETWTRLNA